MIVWSTIEVSCPMCAQRLPLRCVGGGVAKGQDSDLFVRMSGEHVIQAEIHCCPKCHFAGLARDFLDRQISEPMVERFFHEYAERLHDEDAPEDDEVEEEELEVDDVDECSPLPHTRYAWSAVLAPLLGLTPKEIGLRMLRAYWCLRIEPSAALPRNDRSALRTLYLRQAIAFLRKSLRQEKDPNLVYLVAELCRRNGSFVRSENYFDRFLTRCASANGSRLEESYLHRAAQRLVAAARAHDASEKTMEELLYEADESSEKNAQPKSARGESKRGESKRGESKRGESKRGESKRGESKRGESKRGESERGESERGESERGESERGESERGESERGENGQRRRRPRPTEKKRPEKKRRRDGND